MEADAVLVIDLDAELSGPLPTEGLKTVARRDSEFAQIADTVQLVKLPSRGKRDASIEAMVTLPFLNEPVEHSIVAAIVCGATQLPAASTSLDSRTDMATFSVLLLTAPPPGLAGESGGAYVKIDGREALLRTAELFLNRDEIKQIQVVVSPDMLEEAKRRYAAHFSFSGIRMLSGGPKWMDQIAAGGKSVSAEATHVIVHDAARPAVPPGDIEAIMEAAAQHAAVALIATVRASLVELDEGSSPIAYHPPGRFAQLLSPQAFSRERFAAMAQSGKEVHASELRLIKGSPLNVRLGGPGDASLVKSLITMLPKPKVKPPSSPFEEAQW
jgi:2-C-methyl-D-erythritol 4-phosphate cytidylyltransferase